MKRNENIRIACISLLFFVLIAVALFEYGIGRANASVFDDAKIGLASSLGASPQMAGYLLTALLLGAVIITFAIAKIDVFAQILTAFVVLAFAVVVGWMDYWILLLGGMLVVIWFTSKMAKNMPGAGGE